VLALPKWQCEATQKIHIGTSLALHSANGRGSKVRATLLVFLTLISLPTWSIQRCEFSLDRDVVLVGDAIVEMKKMPRGSVDFVFADPPYNLQLEGGVSRPDYQTLVASVDDKWDKFSDFVEYDRFTRAWLRAARRAMKPDATIVVIGTYHNIFRVGAIMQDLGFWILNDIIWRKTNPMPNFLGRRFTNAHETMIWAARGPDSRYTFNYQALKAGNEDCQVRSDWLLPICVGKERLKDRAGRRVHPTQKPEALIARILLATTNIGDLVLDPFFGSGTTGAVARLLRRSYVGIERDRKYASIARKRIRLVRRLPEESVARVATRRSEPRVAFASLIEAKLIKPGEELFDITREHSALVRADGTLSSGRTFGSIHKMGAIAQGLPACNGWTFWYVERRGKLLSIDELRDRMRAMNSSD